MDRFSDRTLVRADSLFRMNNIKKTFTRLRRRVTARREISTDLPLFSRATSVYASSSVGQRSESGRGDRSVETTVGDGSLDVECSRVIASLEAIERWIIACNRAMNIIWKCTRKWAKVTAGLISFAIFTQRALFDPNLYPTAVDVKADMVSTVAFDSSARA